MDQHVIRGQGSHDNTDLSSPLRFPAAHHGLLKKKHEQADNVINARHRPPILALAQVESRIAHQQHVHVHRHEEAPAATDLGAPSPIDIRRTDASALDLSIRLGRDVHDPLVDHMMPRAARQIVDGVDIDDVIPDFRRQLASPGIGALVADAARAGKVDEERGSYLLPEAGEDGGCAAQVVNVASVWREGVSGMTREKRRVGGTDESQCLILTRRTR